MKVNDSMLAEDLEEKSGTQLRDGVFTAVRVKIPMSLKERFNYYQEELKAEEEVKKAEQLYGRPHQKKSRGDNNNQKLNNRQ